MSASSVASSGGDLKDEFGGMMLQNMRDNAQSWVAKVIVGVIVLMFALTGWESINRFTSSDDKAAEVNGKVISKTELEQGVSQQRRQLMQQLQQLGDQFDPDMIDEKLLRDSVLQGLIERTVMLEGAEDANLYISEQMVDQMLLNTPDFQTNGQFDANRFDVVIRNMGLGSRMEFRALVREELMLAQLRNAYQATSFSLPVERQRLALLEKQTRDFAVITLATDPASVEVQASDIEQYYAEHLDNFMTPEQVVLEALTLSRSDFFDQTQMDEKALESLYQREIGHLTEQRRAAHILFVVDGDDASAALEQAATVKARVDAGESFAALAKEFSADSGTAKQGGDLGFVEKDSFDPDFERALFALQEGEVSEPVRTEFGVHLVKLTDLQSPEVPSLEDMRPVLEAELKSEQVERRFVEASQELANLAYESEDLQEPARILNLKVETFGPLGRSGGEGITANPKVMAAAFSEEVLLDLRNSQLLELDADTVVVVRVKQHLRAEQRSLAEVSAEIKDTLQFIKSTEQAAKQAEQWVEQLRQGKLDEAGLAEQLGQQWQQHEAVGRADRDISQVLMRDVFTISHSDELPAYAHFKQPDGSQWIVALHGVATPDETLSEEELAGYGSYIAGQTGQQDFTAVQERLKQGAKIKQY